jgi:ABC-type transport system involved in multi-copper enzyme maturation permease subunit
MIRNMAFEWLKLTRRWMPRVLVVMVAGLTTVAFWGQATRSADRANLLMPRGWLVALILCSFFAPFFWPVLGGSWAGNEYGWGTMRTILTRRPYRIEQVISALLVLFLGLAVALLVLLLVASGAGLVIAVLTNNHVFTSGVLNGDFVALLVKGFLIAWYVSAFYLFLAYATATLFRSAAVGIGFGIGATFAQFILFRIFDGLGGVWKTIAEHFPVQYANNLITEVVGGGLVAGSNIGRVDPGSPSVSDSLVWLTLYAAVLMAITLYAVRVRDVTA